MMIGDSMDDEIYIFNDISDEGEPSYDENDIEDFEDYVSYHHISDDDDDDDDVAELFF